MPNAIVLTGYGPPEVLKWAEVPLTEPGEGQIRIKVKAAGISPTDLVLRAGYLKDAIPLPPNAVLGYEAAGTVSVRRQAGRNNRPRPTSTRSLVGHPSRSPVATR